MCHLFLLYFLAVQEALETPPPLTPSDSGFEGFLTSMISFARCTHSVILPWFKIIQVYLSSSVNPSVKICVSQVWGVDNVGGDVLLVRRRKAGIDLFHDCRS